MPPLMAIGKYPCTLLRVQQTCVGFALHPVKDQTDKSGKKLPIWDMNEAEEQPVGEKPWADVQ